MLGELYYQRIQTGDTVTLYYGGGDWPAERVTVVQHGICAQPVQPTLHANGARARRRGGVLAPRCASGSGSGTGARYERRMQWKLNA
jgi:hypothetical protein